jgi:cytochrome c-type biogenesis protein CcmH/NrfG
MSALRPWAAWIGGIAGWFVAQQLGSQINQLDCQRAHGGWLLVIGAVGALLALSGAAISWPVWRAPGSLDQPYAGSRRFIAGTGELAAGLFLLAILFQTLASLIIPRCYG